MKLSHEDVVRQFNRLGYAASFAAVAKSLRLKDANVLYNRYPSREALGEAWLCGRLPRDPGTQTIRAAYLAFMSDALVALEDYRDFSRSWLAAMALTGPGRMSEVLALHDAAHCYFLACLDAQHANISLPPPVAYEDVRNEIADALAGVALMLVAHWESDRSVRYARTIRLVNAIGYLIDALLVRRAEFGDAGLLVHLHEFIRQPHDEFLRPLLDLVLRPERAGRLLDPVSLLELVRDFRPSPAKRR